MNVPPSELLGKEARVEVEEAKGENGPAWQEPRLERGFEWIDGRAVEKPMGAKASVVGARLTGLLNQHVSDNKLGFVFNAEGAYRITSRKKSKVRKPDVSFVARGRLPNEEVPEGDMTIAPDLVTEVISPNDLTEDTEQRVTDFLAAGTRLFWIVHPAQHTIWVLRRDGSALRLTEGQDLSGEDVVPGFSCPIANLFTGI